MAGPLEVAAASALGGFLGAAAPGLGLILWNRWRYRRRQPSWSAPLRRVVCLLRGHVEDPIRVGRIDAVIYCKRRCGWEK
jgi:hypothetical protein